jgi:hypothetical protein
MTGTHAGFKVRACHGHAEVLTSAAAGKALLHIIYFTDSSTGSSSSRLTPLFAVPFNGKELGKHNFKLSNKSAAVSQR